MFSTQANTGPKWSNKTNVAFWRGRDSRKERLDLVEMSRNNPEIVDAALTNMFFFPKDENKYGKIVKHVSFFDFFKVSLFDLYLIKISYFIIFLIIENSSCISCSLNIIYVYLVNYN